MEYRLRELVAAIGDMRANIPSTNDGALKSVLEKILSLYERELTALTGALSAA
jgi:hypothetical protein